MSDSSSQDEPETGHPQVEDQQDEPYNEPLPAVSTPQSSTKATFPLQVPPSEKKAQYYMRGGQQFQENNIVPVHTVFFFSIPFKIDQNVFQKFVEKFGDVQNIYEKREKGNYFVTYYDLRSAIAAVEQDRKETLNNRLVRMNYAYKAKRQRKDPLCATVSIQLQPSSADVSEDEVRSVFSAFGDILQIRKESDKIYVVKYYDLRSPVKAIECKDPIILGGEPCKVELKPGEDDGLEQEEPEPIHFNNKRSDSRDNFKRNHDRDNRGNGRRNDHNNRYNQPPSQQQPQYGQYQQYPPQYPPNVPYYQPPPYGYPQYPGYPQPPYGQQPPPPAYGQQNPPPPQNHYGAPPTYPPPYGQAPPPPPGQPYGQPPPGYMPPPPAPVPNQPPPGYKPPPPPMAPIPPQNPPPPPPPQPQSAINNQNSQRKNLQALSMLLSSSK